MKYTFFSDFDGTITREDVIDRILDEFADPKWKEIEQSWVRGEIGSRECLTLQAKLINAEERDLLDFVEAIEIDETFVDFVRYCRKEAFGIVVVSDGIDFFIHTILNRYGLRDVRVYANQLVLNSHGYEMLFPHFRKDCLSGSGICKCRVMEGLSYSSSINILIGDGRSDFCIARKAGLTFAKSELINFCRDEKLSHIQFSEFEDITKWLRDQKGRRTILHSEEHISVVA